MTTVSLKGRKSQNSSPYTKISTLVSKKRLNRRFFLIIGRLEELAHRIVFAFDNAKKYSSLTGCINNLVDFWLF